MSLGKILVVDDEQDIVRAVTMRLRAAGYDVIAANDGQMGTQKAIQESPDLVILDIGMPAGSGHAVAERLQNNMSTMTTPVIFLTARTSIEDRMQARMVHAAGYITKPFTSRDLLDTVSRALKVRDIRNGTAEASL